MNEAKLQTRLASRQQFDDHLRLLPEGDAVDLLRRFRMAADAEAFLKCVQGPGVLSLLRPSDLRTAWQTGPPTQSTTEFELMVRHSAVFLKINPISRSFLEHLVGVSRSPARSPARSTFRTSASRSGARRDLCDERLSMIQWDYWTKVPIANDFAASARSHHLEKDHLVMDFFDADVALDDLVTCYPQFCTPFFISALMFAACQSYTLIDVSSAPFAIDSFKEAEILCRAEESVESIATVAALMIFGHATVCHGKDTYGQRLLDIALRMSKRLGLFGIPADDPVVSSFCSRSMEGSTTASHTAWGAFNYLALFSSFYPREPIRYPPALPMPGRGLDEINAEGRSHPVHRHTAAHFYVQCKLWVIAEEIASVYKQDLEVPVTEKVSLAFVESKYWKLVACMEELGGDRVRGGDCPARVFLLHIYFNAIVLNTFHPFVQKTAIFSGRLRGFAASDSHPRTIYAASVAQLKQLTLWYHLRDGKSMSIWVNPGSLVLVGALLRDEDLVDLSQRLYILLGIRCCANLYVAYPIFLDIARAFLAMSLQRKAVSSAEASALVSHVRQNGAHHTVLGEVVSKCFPDADLASREPDKASAHDIAELFENLNIFEQFTTGGDFVPDDGGRGT
ncbi:hypothetical protein F4778DRAFT_778057 [Xylariomycetidae sp. FL2044]|nr:hypothetical protein F4778DRAFT_778046 [Xylariomycetidae sp. FL2044]KAH9907630.1 hypothetical protein F4778DRAFT_778057 [Xylariomycetidae sp. FL2044]